MRKSELVVITKAKDLCSYIFTITQNSPKKYRFSLVSRMENLCLEAVENFYRANDCFLGSEGLESEQRLKYQKSAMTSLRILAAISMIAREQNCILPKQYEIITRMVADCLNLAAAWIKSDKNRYKLD